MGVEMSNNLWRNTLAWVRFNLVENITIGPNQQAKACTTYEISFVVHTLVCFLSSWSNFQLN